MNKDEYVEKKVEETHHFLLNAYDQPEEFQRTIKDALSEALEEGARRERDRVKSVLETEFSTNPLVHGSCLVEISKALTLNPN